MKKMISIFRVALLLALSTSFLRADNFGRTTLIWVSMDGVRFDYIDRVSSPFFEQVKKEGAFSQQYLPSFPPITFPSHCCEATGVTVEKHGITGNGFYDSSTHQSYHFPSDSSLLQAEPIWLTAQRQGVDTLVFDWPLSQAESAPVHADYFNQKFDNAPTDSQRLNNLLDAWRKDDNKSHLRLLMGYVEATDPVGHQEGPDSPKIADEVKTLGAELGEFWREAQEVWKQHSQPNDELYFLLTTDHGMSNVEHWVNLEKMLGVLPNQPDVHVETVANVGSIFVVGGDREKRLAEWTEKLRAWPFMKVYRREELPVKWGYQHPTRVGDLVAILPKGYTFNKGAPQPVSETGSPKGMHGYPLEDDPEMKGVTLLLRYPQPLGGKDLGPVKWDQLHPTAAAILGIQPAAGVTGMPFALPGVK